MQKGLHTRIEGNTVYLTIFGIKDGKRWFIAGDNLVHSTLEDAQECERGLYLIAQVANWQIQG